MPEVSGNAAHIIDPYKPEEITEAIIKILSEKDYSEDLCKKGLERSKLFSWENMAKEYLKLYKLIHLEHSKK